MDYYSVRGEITEKSTQATELSKFIYCGIQNTYSVLGQPKEEGSLQFAVRQPFVSSSHSSTHAICFLSGKPREPLGETKERTLIRPIPLGLCSLPCITGFSP